MIPFNFIKPQLYMGRAANYLKRPTSRKARNPGKTGTRPVFSNSSPTLIFFKC